MTNAVTLIATDAGEVRMSTMTGKLQGIQAINTDTTSNPYCIAAYERETQQDAPSICKNCYSMHMLRTFRKSAVPRFAEHSNVLSARLLDDHEIGRVFADVVRVHGHGELINLVHYYNVLAIANNNPRTLFVLWTKRRDLIHLAHTVHGREVPVNLQLIYSNPNTRRVLKRVPKYFAKVFNVIDKSVDRATVDVNCHGACRDCMLCYTRNNVRVIVEEMK